jgi:hypothetical protein
MTSTCVVTRVTGRTLNEDTGEYEDITVPVYSGPCKVRFESARVFRRDMESQLLAEQRPILFVPIDGTGSLTVDDVATITASPIDAALVGMRIRLDGQHAQTYATARRIPGEVLT